MLIAYLRCCIYACVCVCLSDGPSTPPHHTAFKHLVRYCEFDVRKKTNFFILHYRYNVIILIQQTLFILDHFFSLLVRRFVPLLFLLLLFEFILSMILIIYSYNIVIQIWFLMFEFASRSAFCHGGPPEHIIISV